MVEPNIDIKIADRVTPIKRMPGAHPMDKGGGEGKIPPDELSSNDLAGRDLAPGQKSDADDTTAGFSDVQLRALGWVPEDEYEGAEPNYLNREEFVASIAKNGNKMKRMAGKAKARTDPEVAALRATVSSLEGQLSKNTMATNAAQASDLRRQYDEAVEDGDAEAADKIFKDLTALTAAPASDTSSGHWYSPEKMREHQQRLASEHDWYGSAENFDLTNEINKVFPLLSPQKFADPDEFWDAAEEIARRNLTTGSRKEDLPAAERKGPTVAARRGKVPAKKAAAGDKTFEELTREEKIVAETQMRLGGKEITKEVYMASYNRVFGGQK